MSKTNIHDFREMAIPVTKISTTTNDYRDIHVDLSSEEAQERLVDIATLGIASESYYARSDGFNSPHYRAFRSAPATVYCRETIARKLLEVNEYLDRFGVELFVWDGYRPISCQEEIWNYLLAQARAARKEAAEDELEKYVARYCSDPRGFDPADPRTWPTHVTGGAVDLTLRRIAKGELLYMGGTFDDPSPVSHTCYFETLSEQSMTASDLDARRNRRMLYWAMISTEFTNYPSEWWHFDWGTQMWILNRTTKGPASAVYGPVGSDLG